MILKFVNVCVIPSFLPIIAVTVDDLAKFAPKLTPKLVPFVTPDVTAIAFVTAFPRVLATAVPVVFATVFETVLVIPFVKASVAVLPKAFAVLLFQPC